MCATLLTVSVPGLSRAATSGDRREPLLSLMSGIRAGDSSVVALDPNLVRELFDAPRRAPLATSTLVLAKQSVQVTVTWKNRYVDPPTTGTATALQQDD